MRHVTTMKWGEHIDQVKGDNTFLRNKDGRPAQLQRDYGKLIITLATTGNINTRENNKDLPCSPQEMADQMHECIKLGALSASRGAAAPSRHRRASSPGEEVVGGLLFNFEAFRTEPRDRDAPRRRVHPAHPLTERVAQADDARRQVPGDLSLGEGAGSRRDYSDLDGWESTPNSF